MESYCLRACIVNFRTSEKDIAEIIDNIVREGQKDSHLNFVTSNPSNNYESKQTTMGKGDFTRIAETMRESGSALVSKLDITKGLKVLDLGCGDGTTAILLQVGRWCNWVDIASNLVEAGNKRAKAEGLCHLQVSGGMPQTQSTER